jgi:lipopolysaccharide/colanic/teichoic acid biosynthesis glycosyltransferase
MLGSIVYRERRFGRFLRRGCDLTFATLALAIALPLLLFAALAIWLDDGGPVFFLQKRVGHSEQLFTIYKTCTMNIALCGDGLFRAGSVANRGTLGNISGRCLTLPS